MKPFPVRLPQYILAKLTQVAGESHMTKAEICRAALDKFFWLPKPCGPEKAAFHLAPKFLKTRRVYDKPLGPLASYITYLTEKMAARIRATAFVVERPISYVVSIALAEFLSLPVPPSQTTRKAEPKNLKFDYSKGMLFKSSSQQQ